MGSTSRELLEEAFGGAIDNLVEATDITDISSMIRATCGEDAINVSVLSQVTVTLGGKTFHVRTGEKPLGNCKWKGFDSGTVYDLGCGCCKASPFYPENRKDQR
jgi:hypothetical protein